MFGVYSLLQSISINVNLTLTYAIYLDTYRATATRFRQAENP